MKIHFLLLVYIIAFANTSFAQDVVAQDSNQHTDTNLESVKKTEIPSGSIILADMEINNPVMYSQYQSARKKQITGTMANYCNPMCIFGK
ncbi:MAG: hypothetical protein LBR55_07585 [Bacteroidales bacterium]|jgi:hypothetical protein|nr:hypothetical protein [Bacteroidales bacterium]